MKKVVDFLKRNILSGLLAAIGAVVIEWIYSQHIIHWKWTGLKMLLIPTVSLYESAIRMIMLFFPLFILFVARKEGVGKTFAFLEKYRFLIAGLVIVFFVAFNLNFSSIGAMTLWLGGGNTCVWGSSLIYRSDEYAQSTMMALSQAYNGEFNYFSDLYRGGLTDMFIIYGQPVKHIFVLFRPFHLGYLLLGASRGLAFYGITRLVTLILVSYEFGKVLTKGKKKLAIIYTLLTAFAPAVQWWLNINAFVEMLISLQLFIVLFHKYILSENWKKKILYAVGIVWSLISFVLTFYPSWQVPLAYIMLGLVVWQFVELKAYKRLKKADIFIIGGAILCFVGILAGIYFKSEDAIQKVLHTEYPGARVETGGVWENIIYFLRWPGDVFYHFVEGDILPNFQNEIASFIDFFPLGFVLAGIVFFGRKKKDALSCILTVISVILLLWCLFPFPVWLAKISLLSMTQAYRTVVIAEFANMLLLIRSLALMEENTEKHGDVALAMVGSVTIAIFSLYAYGREIPMGLKLIVVVVAVGSGVILLVRGKKVYNKLLAWVILLSFFGGVIINPVQRGIRVVSENPLLKEVERINKEQEGQWLYLGRDFACNNALTTVGAATVNTLATYPNTELWSKFNYMDNYSLIYNRYAYVLFELMDENTWTSFELLSADGFMVHMNIKDLRHIPVNYIVSEYELTVDDIEEVQFELLETIPLSLMFGPEERYIYRVHYN